MKQLKTCIWINLLFQASWTLIHHKTNCSSNTVSCVQDPPNSCTSQENMSLSIVMKGICRPGPWIMQTWFKKHKRSIQKSLLWGNKCYKMLHVIPPLPVHSTVREQGRSKRRCFNHCSHVRCWSTGEEPSVWVERERKWRMWRASLT